MPESTSSLAAAVRALSPSARDAYLCRLLTYEKNLRQGRRSPERVSYEMVDQEDSRPSYTSDGVFHLRLAPAFLPLLEPHRFKGARGGRGAAKTHFVAEKLIADCIEGHHRVACCREFQSSIRESSKQILEDKIRNFNMTDLFTITEQEIRGPNDSLFIFKGLDGKSADSIKSIVGITRVWVEEAQRISKRSVMLLTPSIRHERGLADAEFYFTWNPMDERDPVEQIFKDHDPDDPDFAEVSVTYDDNPWFPDDLRREMERDRARDPEKYAHVWLGQYQRHSEARVFHNWRIEEFETPEDARFYFGADWGFATDPTVLVRCWLQGHQLYVDYEAYRVGCPIENIPALFLTVPGAKDWRIRADSARPDTIDYVHRRGFRIVPSIKGKNSVEDGIEFLKSFDIIVHPRCKYTINELSTYSWKVDPRTEDVLPVLEDKENHVIDSLRYALEGERHAGSPLILSPKALAQAAALPSRNRFTGYPARNRFANVR